VNTEPGKGTTFSIYLPAAPAEAVEGGSGSPLETLPHGNGEVVLVVDDEATVRGAAKTVLNAHGYQVLTASDGTEALAIFAAQAGRIAAVITDLMMPFMDGIALIRALRKMQPNVPIAASTGLGEKPQLAELKSLGVAPLLSKPYGAEALLKVTHELVQSNSPAR
jgi:CheY-like chemotaxis protein